MSDSQQTHLAFAVSRWLQETGKTELAASVAAAYSVDLQDASQREKYGKGPGLQQVFDIFLKTQSKLAGAAAAGGAAAAANSPSGAPAAGKQEPSAEDVAKAESLKAQGNKAMSTKDFGAAIAAYTDAIQLNPNSAVYFSNRSAAYSQLAQHDKSIEDAKQASKVDPTFAKAYSRLGHALFSTSKFEEAAQAYAKGLELDPSNQSMKSGLEIARKHAQDAQDGATSPSERSAPGAGAGAGAGGLDFGALASMMGGGGGGGGGGGMPDLGACVSSHACASPRGTTSTDKVPLFSYRHRLLQNPAIMQMAQQMMQNGGLEGLMNNPMLRNMMGGGGGGMPE